MPELTDEALLNMIDAGESDYVEFKESLSGNAPDRIREAVCAFANDLPDRGTPGLVFIGVRNDKTIVGLPVTDDLLRRLADVKTDGNVVPPPSLTVEKRILNGREIAVVSVRPSDSPPVRYKGAIHVRIGTRRGVATAQEERILNEKRRFGDRPFDLQPIPPAGVSDLNVTQFENEYLTQAFPEEIRAANDRTLEQRLAAMKMIVTADQPTATVLGILTIGTTPRDFLPGAYVQFLKIDGNDPTDANAIADAEEIDGTISDLLRRLDEKLKAHNRTAIQFTGSDVERRTELYPLEALQQIARNAVMHRTYEGTNAPTRVTWFNDRIEVLSPGGAFGTVNAENFGQPGYIDYRNPNLAESMKILGYVQRFGMGIGIAKRQLANAGHPKLEFDVSDSFVLVTIKARPNP